MASSRGLILFFLLILATVSSLKLWSHSIGCSRMLLDLLTKDYWTKGDTDSGYGAKAHDKIGQVRGRGFRHENTKMKCVGGGCPLELLPVSTKACCHCLL